MKISLHIAPFVLALLIARAGAAEFTTADVEAATGRALTLVTRAASNWQKNKTCFACHHQTLPMLAVREAARAGFAPDAAWLRSQAETTHRYFAERIEDLDEGEHVPGGAATTAYGFWALILDERPPDATTTAMVHYLLQIQGVVRLRDRKPDVAPRLADGRWIASCRRAPLQGSDLADTVLALLGMEKYALPAQRPEVVKARAAAEAWLGQVRLKTQQDRLWRLWGLHQLGGDAEVKRTVQAAILAAQRDDGGWAERDERTSDAYSTAQTLFMLCRTGMANDAPAILRARDYLLRTRFVDGSWLVKSHQEKKVQPYFEDGDPHGEHQFLSTAATAWAAAGLSQLLPPKPVLMPHQ